MRASLNVLVSFAFALPLTVPAAQAQSCSTEKVNHEDCHITIDRRYPVTLPTIQMSPGKRVTVYVDKPLEFETLSLDETGATALPGTDQLAAILTAAAPDFKGFVTSNVTIPAPQAFAPLAVLAFDGGNPDQAQMDIINNELAVMRSMLVAAQVLRPTTRTTQSSIKTFGSFTPNSIRHSLPSRSQAPMQTSPSCLRPMHRLRRIPGRTTPIGGIACYTNWPVVILTE